MEFDLGQADVGSESGVALERCSVGIHVYGRRRVRTLLDVNKATLFGLLAATALALGVGCVDETKLTSSDLDTLCSAARAAVLAPTVVEGFAALPDPTR